MADDYVYFEEEEVFDNYPANMTSNQSFELPSDISEAEAASAAISVLLSDLWFVKAADDVWLDLKQSLQRKLALNGFVTSHAIPFLVDSIDGTLFSWDDAFEYWSGTTLYPFEDLEPLSDEDYSVINDVSVLTYALSDLGTGDLLHTPYRDEFDFENNSCGHNWSIGILSCSKSSSYLGKDGAETALLACLAASRYINVSEGEIKKVKSLRNELIEILGKNFDFWVPTESNHNYFDYAYYKELAIEIRDFLWEPGNLSAEFRALLSLTRGPEVI